MVQIEPGTLSRNPLATRVKDAEMMKRGSRTLGRKNPTTTPRKGSINLSANLWDTMHQRELSKSTLKELPGVKISPRTDHLPNVTLNLQPHTRRFVQKVAKEVPKGQQNYSGTISFLERIISDQDNIKTLHNAFTRKKNSLYH